MDSNISYGESTMTQGATGNKKWNKNRKQSLKNLGYQSRVTTKEACSQREMFVGMASKLTRDLTALQKYSANFEVFLHKEEIKWVLTSRFVLSQIKFVLKYQIQSLLAR